VQQPRKAMPGRILTYSRSTPLGTPDRRRGIGSPCMAGRDRGNRPAPTIAEVIEQCLRDTDARDYFTGRTAAEPPKPDTFPDDRRT
jgi:hypothetical protein